LFILVDHVLISVNSLLGLGGDLSDDGPGVYMHIITDKKDPTHYYLYVGQANNLQRRISDHCRDSYQQNHMSLHYHVLRSMGGQGTFVILTKYSPGDDDVNVFLLNIMEMWCCMIFQTLPEKTLDQYLPADVKIPHPGAHLNLALPLSQFPDDPEEIKKSFSHALDSTDPLIVEYFRKAQLKRAAAQTEKTIARAVYGGTAVLARTDSVSSRARITMRDVNIHISAALVAESGSTFGDRVGVQYELFPFGPHPRRYAKDALDTDLAIRLAIRVMGKTADIWPSCHGEKNVKKVNSLVDFMEGVPLEEIEKSPCRVLSEYKTRGRVQREYT